MRTIICLFAMVALLACCKSKKNLMTSEGSNLTRQPAEVVVKEEIQDSLTISVRPDNLRREDVKLTQGDTMMRYCVIVGSFMYEQNATRLRAKLVRMGFLGSCIMQNHEGMYRVSASCNNDLQAAQARLKEIRIQYPQFSDAWLLQAKD